MSTLKNFVNNEFVPASSSATVDAINPATQEVTAKVPLSTKTDLDNAIVQAQAAFPSWSGMTIKARAALMFKLHMLIQENDKELAELIVKENGKNMTEALADVAKGNETAEWATSLPQLALGQTLEVSRGISCTTKNVPLGVVGAIVPFNFPLMVPFWTVPIALTMGNCVILKPSEKVPLTMQRVADYFVQAGFPPGVFQILHGTHEIASAMCTHPDISAVSFVGSSKIAEIVKTSAQRVNKRVLALGGAKNHLIALKDCDLNMASRDIVASFAGAAGQRCMAASALIIVDESGSDFASSNSAINNTLLEKIVEGASKIALGQEPGQLGPVIDTIAMTRIKKYITEAVEKDGATLLLDGREPAIPKHLNAKGNWLAPSIILHKSRHDQALQDEIFGPVLSVIVVDSWEEALSIENGNPYGNAACIYTERGASAEYFTKRFRAGMLGVNIGIPVPREPFSFGGLYGTLSKFGDFDVTGQGAMNFFSNPIKITSKWTASYSSKSASNGAAVGSKRKHHEDKANFDGKM
jgi:malonate-semialdehyde dehydrogenase (acetylating) / methylmalonate-semialdehyde dehydrogenase